MQGDDLIERRTSDS
jgi:hypothetical protein